MQDDILDIKYGAITPDRNRHPSKELIFENLF